TVDAGLRIRSLLETRVAVFVAPHLANGAFEAAGLDVHRDEPVFDVHHGAVCRAVRRVRGRRQQPQQQDERQNQGHRSTVAGSTPAAPILGVIRYRDVTLHYHWRKSCFSGSSGAPRPSEAGSTSTAAPGSASSSRTTSRPRRSATRARLSSSTTSPASVRSR